MPSPLKTPRWQEIIRLGERLLESASLVEQHDQIVATVRSLLGDNVTLWLDEHLSRTPGHEPEGFFPPAPESQVSLSALAEAKTIHQHVEKCCTVAVPMLSQNMLLGVLQVDRLQGPPFKENELELLEALAKSP